MNAVISFEFDTLPVRGLNIDGAPWFVAKDLASALGYADTAKAVKAHCKCSRPVGVGVSPTLDLDPQTTIIPERDMYRLIMRSKLPAAERFEEWVVGEVLPTIRKTGGYGTEAVLGITAFPTNEVINLLRQQIELQSELIESLRKKQKHARRDEFIKTTRVLFHRTSLSDNEIADALSDFLGDEMPEWVAYQRRKFDEETATRN